MPARAPGYGLARVLSKRGLCSRAQAERLIREGRVRVAGRICRDPEQRTSLGQADIEIDGEPAAAATPFVYLMLNKPRGLVTTRADERSRATVYDCLDDAALPWLAPVGRLDLASEGLLLFTNDSAWAARITAPASHLRKTYHVQVRGGVDEQALSRLRDGIDDAGERLVARDVAVLRTATKTTWLQFVLDEGRNRQIRRMLAASGFEVLRLVRVAIGDLPLGSLGKGQWRHLAPTEAATLAATTRPG